MAYLERTTDPRRRTTAIMGVIAIHALIGYVLVTGLVQKFVPRERDVFAGFFDPAPSPPLPKPEPKETHKPSPRSETETAPKREIDLTKADDRVPETKKDSDKIEVIPTPTATYTPSNPPNLGFKPKAAAPRNPPARWATTDDYPSRDLREENEGTTFFRVVVGTNGRASACEVVRSSGHPGLDAATCKAVTARARFEPATDANGEKVVGTYSNSVRWQIPR
jgi:protein TonB